jgi:hypothetical protein
MYQSVIADHQFCPPSFNCCLDPASGRAWENASARVVGCWRHSRQEHTHQLQELAQSIPWDWLKPPPTKSNQAHDQPNQTRGREKTCTRSLPGGQQQNRRKKQPERKKTEYLLLPDKVCLLPTSWTQARRARKDPSDTYNIRPNLREPPKHELELPTKLGWDNESQHRCSVTVNRYDAGPVNGPVAD